MFCDLSVWILVDFTINVFSGTHLWYARHTFVVQIFPRSALL